MPGPRMGARPHDFDEKLVRESPTFKKWEKLPDGANLRYACRDFIKGHGDDEERLMRRIMIARRNNLRDHEILKKARTKMEQEEIRKRSASGDGNGSNGANENNGVATAALATGESAYAAQNDVEKVPSIFGSSGRTKRRRCVAANSMTDEELKREMDVPAIEATRSYKAWLALEEGKEFTYNQKYVKGREGHDWLLRKNIWRRMRYRRQNKVIVDKMKKDVVNVTTQHELTVPPNIVTAIPHPVPTGMNEVESAMTTQQQSNEQYTTTTDSATAAAGITMTPVYDASNLPVMHITDDPEMTRVYPVDATANAVATATQIVDHTLLASGADGNGENDAVVEAAVAAAESYVKQARESESKSNINNNNNDGADLPDTTTDDILDSFGPTSDPVKNEQDVVAAAAVAASTVADAVAAAQSVHNPIIADTTGQALVEDHHPTPNPLVNFDGDALDMAAKLAAAASVQVCGVKEEETHDEAIAIEGENEEGDDIEDRITIEL